MLGHEGVEQLAIKTVVDSLRTIGLSRRYVDGGKGDASGIYEAINTFRRERKIFCCRFQGQVSRSLVGHFLAGLGSAVRGIAGFARLTVRCLRESRSER